MENKQKAENIVKSHVYWAVGGGLIPVPIVDILTVSAIQLDMIQQLTTVYEIPYSESESKAVVTALTGSAVSRVAASAFKAIPLVGSLLGGLSMSALSGASTYAVGQVFTNHFENGGTLADLKIAAFIDYYEEMFDKGKEVAAQVAQRSKDKVSPDKLERKLKSLEKLKNESIITEKEYERMKKRLMKKIEAETPIINIDIDSPSEN